MPEKKTEQKPRPWYRMAAAHDGSPAEISIFDAIGGFFFGVSVAEFKQDFDQVRGADEIRLLLNSPGGDVHDAMAIYNLLSSIRSKLAVEVLGIAASAASMVALAGRELVMGQGSFLMIHNPWSFAIGDADQMVHEAEILEKISGQMANIYVAHSDLGRNDVIEKMKAETWFSADEAVEAGFADSVAEDGEVAAMAFDLSRFQHVPATLAAKLQSPTPPSPGEQLNLELEPAATSGAVTTGGKHVTYEEIKVAIAELSGEHQAKLATDLELVPKAETEQLEGRVAALEKANEQLADQLTSRQARELAERKSESIQAALSTGKIKPADREFWEERFDADPDGTEQILAKLPESSLMEQVGTGSGGNPNALTGDERVALKQMGYSEEELTVQAGGAN